MKIIPHIILIFCSVNLSAQKNDMSQVKKIIPIYLNENVTTHLYSSQTIEYSDLSTNNVASQLAKPNILAIKPIKDSIRKSKELGVLTVLGENYMKQYRLNYTKDINEANTEVFIDNTNDVTAIANSGEVISQEIKETAEKLINQKPQYKGVSTKEYGMTIRLNNIFTKDNIIFVDYSIYNATNIRYDIDQIRYKVEDYKAVQAENAQSVETMPIYNYFNKPFFKKKFRNIVAFNKFTFPDNKILNIEATEINSGRKVILHISYKDLLKADNS